jgi:hypothetical protein
MKLLIRAFVVVLVLSGVAATTYANGSSSSAQASIAKTSAWPVPTCPPDDPEGCGIVPPAAPLTVAQR